MGKSVIQIFGRKNCQNTLKAIRFFKERGVKTQFVDLAEKGISPGELKSVLSSIPLEEWIDTEGKEFRNRNLQYMDYDPETEILEDSLLLKTPITRFERKAVLGNKPEIWKEWAALCKEK